MSHSIESPVGKCVGESCTHMPWLIKAIIDADYDMCDDEEKHELGIFITDYTIDRCQEQGVCLAEDLKIKDNLKNSKENTAPSTTP